MSDTTQLTMTPRTTIIDINIPFSRLIVIFIKFGLAAIPAAIVVSIFVTIVGVFLAAIFGTGFVTFWGHGVAI